VGLQAMPGLDKEGEDEGHDPLESGGGSAFDSAGDGNGQPIADAGADESATVGVVVSLDGSGSYDPDGDDLEFTWEIVDSPSGSNVKLDGRDEETCRLQPDVAGVYRVELVVSDGARESDPDDVEITAAEDNGAPVADAGSDQTVTQGDTVQVDGSGSSDPDGDRLSYQWALSTKPTGSSASLSSATAEKPSFTTDKAGVYEVTLTVSDGSESSSPDKARIVADASSGGSSGGSTGCGCSDASPGDALVGIGAALLYFGRKPKIKAPAR
jgi:hypothetical protein